MNKQLHLLCTMHSDLCPNFCLDRLLESWGKDLDCRNSLLDPFFSGLRFLGAPTIAMSTLLDQIILVYTEKCRFTPTPQSQMYGKGRQGSVSKAIRSQIQEKNWLKHKRIKDFTQF